MFHELERTTTVKNTGQKTFFGFLDITRLFLFQSSVAHKRQLRRAVSDWSVSAFGSERVARA